MNPHAKNLVETELGLSIRHTDSVVGGFTAAEKFVVSTEGEPGELFVKMADIARHPSEEIVLDTEAHMYDMVSRYPNLQRYFPQQYAYIREDPYRILVFQYLADVSWGGPWTKENVLHIHEALDTIHHIQLSNEDTAALASKATHLRNVLAKASPNNFGSERRKKLVQQAWNETTGEFTNSRGTVYWRADPTFGKNILEIARRAQPDFTALTVADVNFGNIGFGTDQAYIVDPVYLTPGNPASDMTGLGINILRDLSHDDPELRQFIIETFITSPEALADSLTYWIACSALPCPPDAEPWMDYQQSCGETALAVWQELGWPPHTPDDTIIS